MAGAGTSWHPSVGPADIGQRYTADRQGSDKEIGKIVSNRLTKGQMREYNANVPPAESP